MLTKSKDNQYFITTPRSKLPLDIKVINKDLTLVDMKLAVKSKDAQINELLHTVDTLEEQIKEQEASKDMPIVNTGRSLYRDR